MLIRIDINLDRAPVQNVSQRENFDYDLKNAVEDVLRLYGQSDPVDFDVSVEQVEA